MNPKIYDITILIGIALCVASAWILAGAAAAMGIGGALLIVSTIASAALSVLATKR